jgi:hypothetical protein
VNAQRFEVYLIAGVFGTFVLTLVIVGVWCLVRGRK